MIKTRTMLYAFPVLMGILLLSSCNRKVETATVKSETPPAPAAPAPTPAPPPPAEAVPPPPPPAVSEPGPAPVAMGVPAELRDTYFDFDKSAIRDDAKQALVDDAKLLKAHPDMKVKVEGHCDERGTVEYNLALGNRRAQAVKRYLSDLGIDVSRISTISYGKEKPFCTEHNETCFQKNRRGHFLNLTAGN